MRRQNNFTLRKFTKILTVFIFTIILGILIFKTVTYDNSIPKNSNILRIQDENKDANYQTTQMEVSFIEQELAQKKIIAEEYISHISFENDITLVKKFAQYERLFDFTNYENGIKEFFTTKKISWLVEYKAIMSIPWESIEYGINPETNNVTVTYDKTDIELLAVDIVNVPTFAKDKVFYRSFSDKDIVAQLALIKKEITENFDSDVNKSLADMNLLRFILGNAVENGTIEEIEINGYVYDLTNETQNTSLLKSLDIFNENMKITQQQINDAVKAYEKLNKN